jgi:uncharacterized protein YegL
MSNGPAISLNKLEKEAPALVDKFTKASVSLEKNNLTGQRAAVYLVLDHSGSMRNYYADGSVQHLAEQALGLSANLDDDGKVPLIFFGTDADKPVTVKLKDHQGVVASKHRSVGWGWTNYAAAIEKVVKDYTRSRTKDPAFVIFQTDGDPHLPGRDARAEAEDALRAASKLPIFFAFVGFGARVDFLEKLDDLTGRVIDNASAFPAGTDPKGISDAALYDGLTHEFASWITKAKAAGILS